MSPFFKKISLLLLPTIFMFAFFRIIFLWQYWEYFQNIETGALFIAFFKGFRFDFSIIATSYGILGLVLIWQTFLWRGVSYTISLVAILFWCFFFIITIADLNYYSIAQKRLSFEILILQNDIIPLLVLSWKEYFIVIIFIFLFLILGILYYWIIARENLRNPLHWRWKKQLIVSAIYLMSMIILARGGLQTKPLLEQHAFDSGNIRLGHLTLNPVFTTTRILIGKKQQPYQYLNQSIATQQVRELLKTNEQQTYPQSEYPFYRHRKGNIENKKNIVLIIWESLPAHVIPALDSNADPRILPNLNHLTKQGLLFNKFFSNGVRSVEGIASILSGLPAFDNFAFIMSPFEQHRVISLPEILKAKNYQTYFIHGSFAGSFGIHQYAKNSGFTKVFSQPDISQNKYYFDGTWGVWDEIQFTKALEVMDQATSPFFITLFTLSSHSPYIVPRKEFEKFDENWKNTLFYTDWVLGEFFKQASQKPWYHNTIFLITSDHSAHAQTFLQNARIPLWIYTPDQTLGNQIVPRVGSQVDILPTIIDLLDLDTTHSSTGQSLIQKKQGFAFYDSDTDIWFRDEKAYIFRDGRLNGIYHWQIDPNFDNEISSHQLSTQEELFFQSWRQSGHNSLINNQIAPVYCETSKCP